MKFSGDIDMDLCHTKKVQCYYGYQSMLFLWQHICNTLSNFLTYCNRTQKLFNQSSSNFQRKEILSSPSLTIVMLLWTSTIVVSIATHLQYPVKFLIYVNVTYRLFDESSWNFEEIWVWISPVLRSYLLQKRSIKAVSMATCSNILSAFLHIYCNELKNYSINLHQIFRANRYCPLLHWELHGNYRYQSIWFLWQKIALWRAEVV